MRPMEKNDRTDTSIKTVYKQIYTHEMPIDIRFSISKHLIYSVCSTPSYMRLNDKLNVVIFFCFFFGNYVENLNFSLFDSVTTYYYFVFRFYERLFFCWQVELRGGWSSQKTICSL